MLNFKNFIHPEDEAALRNMEAIPGFASAVKFFLKYGYEKQFHGINMASKIRLSATQLPDKRLRKQTVNSNKISDQV